MELTDKTEIVESHLRYLRQVFNYTTRSIYLEELQITGEIECPYDESAQSKIVERALLGFPPKPLIVIPFNTSIVLSYPVLNESYIIDGSCEALSITSYLFKGLTLKDLKIMTALNGTSFKDFDLITKGRFLKSYINVIHLDWKGDLSVLKYFKS